MFLSLTRKGDLMGLIPGSALTSLYGLGAAFFGKSKPEASAPDEKAFCSYGLDLKLTFEATFSSATSLMKALMSGC